MQAKTPSINSQVGGVSVVPPHVPVAADIILKYAVTRPCLTPPRQSENWPTTLVFLGRTVIGR